MTKKGSRGMDESSPPRRNNSTPAEDQQQTDPLFLLLGASSSSGIPVYPVTIGERGQFILPIELRKHCGILPHEKLMVFRHPCGAQMLVLA
ncbi:MAG TPA: AbrB/MazE/SpoVT family DNA-binding domain-containing protein, partial [Anaerolineae bacterium]